MLHFDANAAARAGSRAATAVTATSGTAWAGLSRALGAMRAAPSTPIRRVTASIYRPPATSSSAPVTYEASSESSHRIAAATSSA